MKAVRYHGPQQPFVLEDVARPTPGPGEVLVQVTAAGMCHTELHFQSGLLNLGVQPITMGHEVVGRIAEVGPQVDAARVGERVIVYYYQGCNACVYCREGEENLCPSLQAEQGFITDGGYAEYVIATSRNAVPLPDHLTDAEAAPIGCSVTTAVHATRLTKLAFGEWAVVYGIGGVGFALVQLARAMGARVIAVGRTPAKLEKARELGAEHVVNAAETEAAAQIRALTNGQGADVVFECVGTAETMKEASAALGRKGRLIFIGYSEASFEVHPIQLVVFEQQVMGSVGATLDDLYTAVDLAARGIVKPLVDRTLPLERFEEGLQAMQDGTLIGKAVLVP
ncbi:MAG: zinc-binding dehydrogenase [Bacteroidota bacterium]